MSQPWTRELLVRVAIGVTLLLSLVCLTGLAWTRLFPAQQFLSLYLHGWAAEGFSGVGFNTSYFAQWALTYLPFAVLVLVGPAPPWARAWAVATVPLVGAGVLLTYQRGAYLVLALEVVLLVVGAVALGLARAPRARVAVIGAAAALVLLGVGFLLLPAGARAIERALLLWRTGDSYREHVLRVAWQMFQAEPLLGIGSGRFAHMFQFYSSEAAGFQWGSLSSHSLYAQVLAEQGILGLGSLLAVLGVTVGRVCRDAKVLGETRPLVLFLLASAGAWLGYGLLQHTFLLRSMQLYFWLTVGLLVGFTSSPRARLFRSAWPVAVFLVVAVLGAIRAHAAVMRPIAPEFAFGLHEPEPDGTRWTRGGALVSLPVAGRVLRLEVACSVPLVAGRHQRVTILVDGSAIEQLTLADPAWHTIEVRVTKSIGARVLVGVRVKETFVPARLGYTSDPRRLGVRLRGLTWAS